MARFALIVFCVLSLCISQVSASDKVTFAVGQDVDAFENYVKDFGHVPDGFMTYTSLQDLEGLWSEADHGGGRQHAQYLIEKYPQCFLQLGLYLVDILPDITAGVYDEHLSRLSEWFKQIKIPVYLRIGYEFDGPHNHYDPQEYAAAYRYIVDYLRKEGVANVEYVWHSFAGYIEGGNLMRWYPGDEYVDWIGISYFDAYADSFRQDVVKISETIHKPLMIAESTPYKIGVTQGEKSWSIWFQRYFNFIKTNDVKMFCYINWDWASVPMFKGQGWGSGRLQDDPYISQKWIEELKMNGYINLR